MTDKSVPRIWTVYKVTSLATNMSYIGITKSTVEKRWIKRKAGHG